jgi:mannose-6-phosphate isomerase-like protein (cupin superfamily)
VTAEGAERVANDVCDFRYRAQLRRIGPGELRPASALQSAETQLLVSSGTLTIMVDGFSASLAAGQFVRIAAGAHYGWHNATSDVVELLFHTVSSSQGLCRSLRVDLPAPGPALNAPA